MPTKPVGEGEQQLAVPSRDSPLALPRRQGFREMLRDALGCFLVVLASIIVYFTDAELAKFIDPLFAIISAISLFVLSYPYSMYLFFSNIGDERWGLNLSHLPTVTDGT